MACTKWRGIEERIDWFLSHNPSGTGMCAQHSWHAIGGNNGCPPAWGAANANQVYDKMKAAGVLQTTDLDAPPRGAYVVWKYGSNGHAAISLGDGTIATTDPSNGKMVGIEPITYPKKWGAANGGKPSGWAKVYNGIPGDVGGAAPPTVVDHGPVYLSKLHYGQSDSDSVSRLQLHLNAHPLDGGETLPCTGNYLTETDEEVRLCQKQHGYGNDAALKSNVGPKQAKHLFSTGCGCTVIDDL